MTKLSHCPSIVVISSDGTRFELPDSAAAYSSLIRLAVAQWSAVHAPSSPSDDDDRWGEDDDDDDDSTVTDLHAAIGGTPNHIDDLTYASSRTRSNITQDDSFEERGLLDQTPAAGREIVRVDAIISQGHSSSVDSSTPDHGTLTEDLLQDDSLESDDIVPEGGAAAPPVRKVSHDSTGPESSSCTRPTPSDGEGNREMSSEINEATPETLPLGNVSLPRKDGDPKAVSQSSHRAAPNTHEVSPRSSLRPTRIVAYAPHEDSLWRDGSSLDGLEGSEESAAADTDGIPRSTAHSHLYNGEFYASSSRTDATATQLEATVTDHHPLTVLPQGIESVEWVSPTSLHQRTPVMLGDDDELVIVRGDGPEETLHLTLSGYRSASPCKAVNSSSSTPTTINGHLSAGDSPRNDHVRSAKASPPRDCSTDPVPPDVGVFSPTGLNAIGETLSGACITATVILIDLGSSKGGEPRESAGTSSTTQEPGSSANAVTSAQVPSSNAGKAPSTSSSRRPSDSGGLHARAAIVQICISYLLHFCAVSSTLTPTVGRADRGSSNSLNLRNDTPTVLPAPLTGPLYTFLSPWELHYLYVVILHYDSSILNMVKVAGRLDINYTFPAGALAGVDDKTRQVLVLPAPSREGVQRLKEVMAAAQGLGIPTLRELCTAWMADFMIRASYGAADYLEAAHIIRQCFRIQADWTRKETDTLKLENEWPANEEDS